MSIHNKTLFMDNLWDWGFLQRYLGGFGISPTDIDGMIERNGHILLLEAKSPGVPIPLGQKIMFDHLVNATCPHCSADCGLWDVVVIWGKPNQPEQMQMWRTQNAPVAADLAAVQALVGEWYGRACLSKIQ